MSKDLTPAVIQIFSYDTIRVKTIPKVVFNITELESNGSKDQLDSESCELDIKGTISTNYKEITSSKNIPVTVKLSMNKENNVGNSSSSFKGFIHVTGSSTFKILNENDEKIKLDLMKDNLFGKGTLSVSAEITSSEKPFSLAKIYANKCNIISFDFQVDKLDVNNLSDIFGSDVRISFIVKNEIMKKYEYQLVFWEQDSGWKNEENNANKYSLENKIRTVIDLKNDEEHKYRDGDELKWYLGFDYDNDAKKNGSLSFPDETPDKGGFDYCYALKVYKDSDDPKYGIDFRYININTQFVTIKRPALVNLKSSEDIESINNIIIEGQIINLSYNIKSLPVKIAVMDKSGKLIWTAIGSTIYFESKGFFKIKLNVIKSGYSGSKNTIVTNLNPGKLYIGMLIYITSFVDGNYNKSKRIRNFLKISNKKNQTFYFRTVKKKDTSYQAKKDSYWGLWVMAEKIALTRSIPSLSAFYFDQDLDLNLLSDYDKYKNTQVASQYDYSKKEDSMEVFTKGLFMHGKLTGYRPPYEIITVKIKIYKRSRSNEKKFKFIKEFDNVKITIKNDYFRYDFKLDENTKKIIETDRENEYNGKNEYIYFATLKYVGDNKYNTSIKNYLNYNAQIIRAASYKNTYDNLRFTSDGYRVCTSDLLSISNIKIKMQHS